MAIASENDSLYVRIYGVNEAEKMNLWRKNTHKDATTLTTVHLHVKTVHLISKPFQPTPFGTNPTKLPISTLSILDTILDNYFHFVSHNIFISFSVQPVFFFFTNFTIFVSRLNDLFFPNWISIKTIQ